MLFTGFPGAIGKGSLFVPGYQYLFSMGGDENRPDISRSQIDLYFVWLLPKGANWLIVNPQIIADHEASKTGALVEINYLSSYLHLVGALFFLP